MPVPSPGYFQQILIFFVGAIFLFLTWIWNNCEDFISPIHSFAITIQDDRNPEILLILHLNEDLKRIDYKHLGLTTRRDLNQVRHAEITQKEFNQLKNAIKDCLSLTKQSCAPTVFITQTGALSGTPPEDFHFSEELEVTICFKNLKTIYPKRPSFDFLVYQKKEFLQFLLKSLEDDTRRKKLITAWNEWQEYIDKTDKQKIR